MLRVQKITKLLSDGSAVYDVKLSDGELFGVCLPVVNASGISTDAAAQAVVDILVAHVQGAYVVLPGIERE